MKTFLVLSLLVSVSAFAGPNRILPVTKEDEMVRAEKEKMAKEKLKKVEAASKKEEDCDDKAKKPVEIKPESISLSGNTGCSLDEAH
jgi:hypothetical protein